jgi:uncharacterized protein
MDSAPTRRGDWLQTFTGGCFWPLDPRPDEVRIEDIAHSLSMRCRYGGHSRAFYSVAEHSVLISIAVPQQHALWGLLHDAAEAFSADVPRPLKQCLPDWKPMEARIMAAVCTRFGLPHAEPAAVKAADNAILADERAALMATCAQEWDVLPPPLGVVIRGFAPWDAEERFLRRFQELSAEADHG